jgi:hypothetical protein
MAEELAVWRHTVEQNYGILLNILERRKQQHEYLRVIISGGLGQEFGPGIFKHTGPPSAA